LAMSSSSRWVTGRWVWGIAVLGCAAGGTGLAWYTGAFNTPTEEVADYDEEAVPVKPEWELPPDLLEAQTEPEVEESEPDVDDGVSPIFLSTKARKSDQPTGSPFDELPEDESETLVRTISSEETSEEPATKPAGKTRSADKPAAPVDGDAGASRNGPLIDLERIEALEAEGNYIVAQQELSRWFWQKPAVREQILPRLDKMARALFFAPQPHYYDPYVVQPGDQLRVIGQKHKLSWEYLAKLNNTDPRRIRAGQKLKVVPGPFGAYVSLSRYELVIHLNGSFVKNYRVGVGKDGTTPLGTFAVKNKMVDPTYYGPEGVIAHDDPQNPLGERWIDIGDSYGIHGTIEPQSIGRNESRGCIRMLNPDVEEVYDFLVVGSEVKIQR
jgi:LysM repeat protein